MADALVPSTHFFMAGMASFTVMPFRKPELTMMPVSSFRVKASFVTSPPCDDFDDRQAELRGKLPVALVVARYAHNGTGAVAHEHIVRNKDGDVFLR